jgi:cytochrome c oxidase cbb3-type subunit 2
MFAWLEKHPLALAIGVVCMMSFAGLVEILPTFSQASRPTVGTKPYTVLELAGRGVYIKDSCNACHSQLIRPFKAETDRYGKYSLSGEYAYDRPFLWGSKRTGPDLLRVGNYRTTDWHEAHMWEPKAVVTGSIMPAYKHQFENLANIDTAYAEALTVMKVFNTPYNTPVFNRDGSVDKDGVHLAVKVAADGTLSEDLEQAHKDALEEAKLIAADMKSPSVKKMVAEGKIPEIVALIAYLNRLK